MNIYLNYINNCKVIVTNQKDIGIYYIIYGLLIGIEIYIFFYLIYIFSFNFQFNQIFFLVYIYIFFFYNNSIVFIFDEIVKKVIYSSTTILKKQVTKKKSNLKMNSNYEKKKVNNQLIDDFEKFCFNIQDITKNHPKFVEIITSYGNTSIIIGNLTTNSNNAVLLDDNGLLYENGNVYLYNDIFIEKLDENNIIKLKQLIENYTDSKYSNKIQMSEKLSLKCSNFIISTTSKITNQQQQIFLPEKKFEEKIIKIENFLENIQIINNRED